MKTKKKFSIGSLFEELEPNLLMAPGTPSPGDATLPQDNSLDQKVDRFLIQYEREASPLGQKFGGQVARPLPMTEAEKRSSRGFFEMLMEADEEMPATEEPADDPMGDMGGLDAAADSAAGGGEDDSADGQAPLPPQINISLFANQLARLVNNYDMLIDPKTIIMRRAQTYIADNYNPKTAKELMSILDRQFGLTPRTEKEKVDDFGSVPIATGAAADAGGGG